MVLTYRGKDGLKYHEIIVIAKTHIWMDELIFLRKTKPIFLPPSYSCFSVHTR